MSDTVYEMAQSAQERLFTGMVTVALGALALSMQFSPKMGKDLWWSLIISWLLFLASVLTGGWRLSKATVYLRHDYERLSAGPDYKAKLSASMSKDRILMSQLTLVQMWTLVGGLVFGLAFVVANYIHCVFSSCPAVGL